MRARSLRSWLVMLTFAAGAAQAADLKDFAGTWVMRLGDRNLFVLTLTQEDTGLRGSWDRPLKLAGSNGVFANMRGGVRHDSVTARFADGVLHLYNWRK